jgi:hypothetical protein
MSPVELDDGEVHSSTPQSAVGLTSQPQRARSRIHSPSFGDPEPTASRSASDASGLRAGLLACAGRQSVLTSPGHMSDFQRDATTERSAATTVPAAKAATTSDSDAVGERVSAILRAAEEAAEQIRADARQKSDARLRQAERDADARIAELSRDAETTRREVEEYARDMRLAVEGYATKHRQDAEEEARRTTSEAEARSKAILESAQENAARLEEGATRHQQALRAETHRLEERRSRVLDGVRELMAVLEELLEDAKALPPRGEALDETLADDRMLSRQRG